MKFFPRVRYVFSDLLFPFESNTPKLASALLEIGTINTPKLAPALLEIGTINTPELAPRSFILPHRGNFYSGGRVGVIRECIIILTSRSLFATIGEGRLSMKRICTAVAMPVLFLLTGFLVTSCSKPAAPQSPVERGKYLVMVGGCNDCHSPKIFTPAGPIPDTTRLLSGFPAGSPIPSIPEGSIAPTAWGGMTTNDMTAWAGMWGMSFSYNLTPDMATGIGGWTEAMFIKTLRTGKFMAMSRDILPPMPWQSIGQMTDDDLKAIFAYLKTLPPINNPIPPALPPDVPAKK
jgi:mono/diheme cytochrome c family protein